MTTVLPEFDTKEEATPSVEGYHFEQQEYQAFENSFECRAVICPEEEGGYSAIALRLPGVVSQGDTKQEAVQNLREAFRGAIIAYNEQGMEIPWEAVDVDRPKDSVEQWIIVNV